MIYLKRLFTPRGLLYLVLLILVLVAVLYWELSGHSSLSENFLAGSIEILITIAVIDNILAIDRKQRMERVNQQNAKTAKTVMSLTIIGIMGLFGFKTGDNTIDLMDADNQKLEALVVDFFNSKEYKEFVSKLNKMEQSIRPKLKKMEEGIEKQVSGVKEILKDAQPYPNPEIVAGLAGIQPQIIATFTVVNEMYALIYKHLPSKGHKNPKKDKAFWPFFQKMYKDLVVTGEGRKDGLSFEDTIEKVFKFLLDVRGKAQANKLHYDA